MGKRAKIVVTVALLALVASYATGFGAHDGSDFDRVIEVGPTGAIEADIVLGSGISFDHGSLQIHSHDDAGVRVQADSSGWGKYAVDIDVEQTGDRITLTGRVEGALHWMFGGPEVDVTIWVPRGFDIAVRIDGGPLLMEDLTGPIRAEVRDAETTLRRAEGPVALRLTGGSAAVEDVDGRLDIESIGGDLEIVGLRGPLDLRATASGHLQIDSVIGPVRVDSEKHRVEIEDVQGRVEVRTVHGRIDVEDVKGDVAAQTTNGGIHLEDIDGRVMAASRRGAVRVEFASAPSGEIETETGRIEVEAPDDAGFDLDAKTGRGRIRIDDFDDVQRIASGTGEPPVPDADATTQITDRRDERRGRKRLRERIAEWRERAEQGDWQGFSAWEEWHAAHEDWADWSEWSGWEDWGEWDMPFQGRSPAEVTARVNGGGPTLRLRTGSGSIHVRD